MPVSLSELQLDVLREVSNIGSGNAATALSKLLMRRIDMTVPNVLLVRLSDAANVMGGPEEEIAAVFFRFTGDAPGNILFALDLDSTSELLSLLFGARVDCSRLTEMQKSAISEVGNILASSYLAALADFTHLNFQVSIPAFGMDMAGALLPTVLARFGEAGNEAILIESCFKEGAEQVRCQFFLVPDPGSLGQIFSSLGIG